MLQMVGNGRDKKGRKETEKEEMRRCRWSVFIVRLTGVLPAVSTFDIRCSTQNATRGDECKRKDECKGREELLYAMWKRLCCMSHRKC